MNEIVLMTKFSRIRFFKRAARKMLFSDWLYHMLAFVISGACFVGINQFGSGISTLIYNLIGNNDLAELFSVTYLVISFAVYIPLLYGLVCFEINAVSGNKNLADLFSAFSSAEKLNRAYTLFFYTLYKVILNFLPALILWYYLLVYYTDEMLLLNVELFGVDIVRLVLTTMLVVLFYIGFLLSSKHFTGVYVSIIRPEISLPGCFMIAKNCTFLSKGEMTGAVFSFLPLFAVSLFTVGFLFVMYTFPYMLITFTMISKFVYESEMTNKGTEFLMYKTNNIDNIVEDENEE